MDSIIQTERKCYVCGSMRDIEVHHLYFGVPGRRNSEQYGLKVCLCREHHRGTHGVHRNRELDLKLKRIGQAAFEEQHSRDEFMKIFGRNYL